MAPAPQSARGLGGRPWRRELRRSCAQLRAALRTQGATTQPWDGSPRGDGDSCNGLTDRVGSHVICLAKVWRMVVDNHGWCVGLMNDDWT